MAAGVSSFAPSATGGSGEFGASIVKCKGEGAWGSIEGACACAW